MGLSSNRRDPNALVTAALQVLVELAGMRLAGAHTAGQPFDAAAFDRVDEGVAKRHRGVTDRYGYRMTHVIRTI